jgi:hypothetical protein
MWTAYIQYGAEEVLYFEMLCMLRECVNEILGS